MEAANKSVNFAPSAQDSYFAACAAGCQLLRRHAALQLTPVTLRVTLVRHDTEFQT